jgi:hypothetical protein
MKTFFFFVSLMILLFACRKDKDNNSKQLYLSKVFKDGLLNVEYFYDANKLAYRRNDYTNSYGVSTYAGFRLYEYNSDKLLESVTMFSKNNGFLQKYRIQYDVNKQPTRMDDLAGDNSLEKYYIFDYNLQGDFSKYSLYDAGTNKKSIEANYSYNDNHKLTKIIRMNYLNNPATKYDSSTYSFNNKTLPTSWNVFETLPFYSLPTGDQTFMEMKLDSSFYYYVDAPPGTSRATFSAKQYNGEGYLIKQHFNYKQTGIFNQTIDFDRTYEYIE